MEQLRKISEAIGSLKTFMLFREEIQINRKQCCLLYDAFNLAFDVIVGEIKQHLTFDEKKTKWQGLENPLKEFHRLIKEGEYYVKKCLEPKDWWAKAISLNLNTDCVELHLHNLLWILPVVLEAIENAAELSGRDSGTIQWQRTLISKKYDPAWMEPELFFLRFANHYLVSQEMRSSLNSVWKEDSRLLAKQISEKKTSVASTRQLAEILKAPREKLHPSSVLVGSKEFQVKRRLDSLGRYKEVQWMGESFVLHQCVCDFESMSAEITLRASVSHPNVLNYMYAFSDDARKEYYVLMEHMNKDLYSYIKEITSERRRVPFTVPVALDIMIQIARGMEYLHSRNHCHGDLNPFNILVKPRGQASDSYLHVKITGFGQSSTKTVMQSPKSSKQTDNIPCIWLAPEVMAELEQRSSLQTPSQTARVTEKADVYSFAMICFELLTGKVPFDDVHMQGDKMHRNIISGGRPLFPDTTPKHLAYLTKKCWHDDPSQRPSFSSICRVLRYTKRFLVMNQDQTQPELLNPPADYLNIEMFLLKKFQEGTAVESPTVSEIPFQMFCYRVVERERTNMNITERRSDSGGDQASVGGDDAGSKTTPEQALSHLKILHRSQSQPDIEKKTPRRVEMKASRLSGQKQGEGARRQPQPPVRGHSLKISTESSSNPTMASPSPSSSGRVSDSEDSDLR